MTTKTIVETYLNAWKRKDVVTIESVLHPEVGFKGPMTQTSGRESFVASIKRMLPLLNDIKLRHLFADGDRALALYDFICAEPIGSSRTAELLTVDKGLIRSSELFFDARPFEAMARARSAPS